MSKQATAQVTTEGLILSGYQKKLKTMKKKFFALYKETPCSVARLEYYDNEKKFKSGMAPKRVIKIKNCFNINRRFDTKYEFVVALSTKDGGFGIVLETEKEMFKWLDLLLSIQHKDSNMSDPYRPTFEHVWQVIVQKKGLAESKGIVGNYHVCLTSKSITFIRIGPEKTQVDDFRIDNIEFMLTTIRRCGDSQCFFYMEVGRQSVIGPGELWMQTEDSLTAKNMHRMIFSAMSTKNESNIEPMRKRSSSANEASKPINVLQRRSTQPENKINSSPQSTICYGRERCDSLPSRNRTSSECSNQSLPVSSSVNIRNVSSGFRTHSYQRHSNSPPVSYNVGYSESEESSISIDEPDDNGSFLSFRFPSRSSDGVILEENSDEVVSSENKSEFSEKAVVAKNVQQSLQTNNQNNYDESYISMTSKNTDKSQENSSLRSDTEFNEFTSDATPTFNIMERSDRPTRTYSIGSKVDHNKLKKRFAYNNDAEQNFYRARAFSVGSRAKIPRSDLQQDVLLPKSVIEPNFNSNNNICNEATTYNQFLNVNMRREKKSTSAPLLIHKSQNSDDRMGDLMELDFSKTLNSRMNTLDTLDTLSQKNWEDTKTKNLSSCTTSYQMSPKSIPSTDNGYLEMKPLGSSFVSSLAGVLKNDSCTATSNESLVKTVKNAITEENQNMLVSNTQSSAFITQNKVSDTKNINSQNNLDISTSYNENKSTLQNPYEKDQKNATCSYNISQKDEQKPETADTINPSIVNEIERRLSSKLGHLSLDSQYYKLKMDWANFHKKLQTVEHITSPSFVSKPNDFSKKDTHGNWKLAHSVSGEDNEFKNSKNELNKLSGYKILHIKSDSSLQSHKVPNRSDIEGQQRHINQIRGRASNCTSLSSSSSSSSTICGSASSSTTCLNNVIVNKPGVNNKKELNCPTNLVNTNTQAKANSKITSRPPSANLEHELYYATLDLPQNSTDVKAKLYTVGAENQNFPANPVLSETNTYAKIDFDHSDSSSTSSKIFDI
ncbi:insulin receptor substrate 1 [Teleopsis dalmanni]|uniref:insulin receptor substrate 1 n=1 Tax=Teleopsis dalmanni TaxID=139649 RepID=UPI0018CD747E|nr:insulin receptor substrate 1 [Teleopsis dalmanni]XP_037958212.1 insulin receptor substrate 1 [Teleopsis dalmanni]